MGRTKGSKNKPKELSPEAKEAAARSSNSLVETMKKEMEARGITPIFISSPDKVKASDIISFPDGWDKMGKVDRLKWLKQR